MPSAPRRSCVPARPLQELDGSPLVLEIEVIGIEGIAVDVPAADELRFPTASELKGLCALAISSAGIEDGHVAIEFVGAERIRALNREHRQIDEPTDVLSFGVDEDGGSAGPRELGDIVICPQHTADLREAVVHGALHLTGMDHETDDGEMLALQAELLRWAR
jgi:probable rRNA maturation factor